MCFRIAGAARIIAGAGDDFAAGNHRLGPPHCQTGRMGRHDFHHADRAGLNPRGIVDSTALLGEAGAFGFSTVAAGTTV